MFDPPSHKAIHDNHNKRISNLINNNGTREKFDKLSLNIIHIPKWKWTNPWNFQAWALEEPLAHPQVLYKTKLQHNFSNAFCKKILHSSFNFYFGLVNISSKHYNIPLQKNQRWEITQHTIDVDNQQFFWSKKWLMYMQMCWTTFDHCYGPWRHI
jgi:hypothetical protein